MALTNSVAAKVECHEVDVAHRELFARRRLGRWHLTERLRLEHAQQRAKDAEQRAARAEGRLYSSRG